MNASTWARDHFLQTAWRSFFSIFTLGMIIDLDLTEAGQAAFYSNMFLMSLSLFYHSALRVHCPTTFDDTVGTLFRPAARIDNALL